MSKALAAANLPSRTDIEALSARLGAIETTLRGLRRASRRRRYPRHRIHPAQCVDLFGNAAGFVLTGQVADDYAGRTGHGGLRFGSPILRAGMEQDVVPVTEQRLRRCETKPVAAPGDEHTRHAVRPSGQPTASSSSISGRPSSTPPRPGPAARK